MRPNLNTVTAESTLSHIVLNFPHHLSACGWGAPVLSEHTGGGSAYHVGTTANALASQHTYSPQQASVNM